MKAKRTRILIVDDHAIVRAGLAAVLGFEHDIDVVGEASNGEEAVLRATETHPDVVVMDLVMPKMDGAAAAAAIRQERPKTKILLLTTYASPVEIHRALDAGVSGAVSKTISNAELADAIRRVADGGETVVSEDIRLMLEESARQPDLTQRQREILLSVTRGLTNSEIATQFGITVSGVKKHLNAIFAKFGAANRTEAVATALKGDALSQNRT